MTVARVSQVVVETASAVTPKARLSQTVVESLSNVNAKVRLSQVVVEVLSSTAIMSQQPIVMICT